MEYRRSRTGNGKKENGYSVEAQFLVIPSPAPAQLSPLSSRSIIVAAIRIPDKTCATYRAFLACRETLLCRLHFFLETAKIIDSRFIQRLYRPNAAKLCKKNIT